MSERVDRLVMEARIRDIVKARKRARVPGVRSIADLCCELGVSRSTYRATWHGTGSPYGPGAVNVANIAAALSVGTDVVEARAPVPDFGVPFVPGHVGDGKAEVLRASGVDAKPTVIVRGDARWAVVDTVTGDVSYFNANPTVTR